MAPQQEQKLTADDLSDPDTAPRVMTEEGQVYSVREKTFTPLPQTCSLSFQDAKYLSAFGVKYSKTKCSVE